MDPRGRVYYVDHNTRTTTWQRPNTDMLNNYSAWQDHRNNRNIQLEHLQNRFLFPNPQQVTPDNDPLGSLPEGWGNCFNSPANHTPLFNLRLFTVESLEFNGSNFWVDLSIIQRSLGTLFCEFACMINELMLHFMICWEINSWVKAAHKDHEIKSPLIIMIPRNLIISKIKYFLLRFLHTVSTTYTQFELSNSTTCSVL